MANDCPSEETLRKVLSHITKGYSLVSLGGESAYVKHFGNEDQYALEHFRENVFKKAREMGLPTEEETLKLMMDEDIWTVEDEARYKEVQDQIESLEETKKNLIIPSQRERITNEINEHRTELGEIITKRQSLLAETCESYAQNKTNDYSIYLSFYKDETSGEKFFSEEEYSELTKKELSEWFGAYNEAIEHLSVDNIKHLAINNVFSMYYNILGSASLYKFFDKPIYKLSFYQLNLLNYAKILHSILENIEKIPEGIKNNPDELISFAESKGRNKNTVEKSQDKQGFSVVGATRKDMEEMGVASEADVSPFELAGLNPDGTLTMEDFVSLS
jgi:hypothetical protein